MIGVRGGGLAMGIFLLNLVIVVVERFVSTITEFLVKHLLSKRKEKTTLTPKKRNKGGNNKP